VTVVTTDGAGTPRGLAVNAFSSISLDPPMVLVCVQRGSTTHPALHRATHPGINILAAGPLDVAKVFASKSDARPGGRGPSRGPGPSGLQWWRVFRYLERSAFAVVRRPRPRLDPLLPPHSATS
jgi:hypothetical protein